MRAWPMMRRIGTAGFVAAVGLIAPSLAEAGMLEPSEALDRYLAAQRSEAPACSDSLYAVRIDASLPTLKEHGSMTGFKRIAQPGQIVYRGLRFTGDRLVKTQVIARFLARDMQQPAPAGQIAVTPANYIFRFDRASDYNGLTAYVFVLKPRRKRAGLFRGELWLDAETAAPLRLWGDLLKAPSVFILSFRFVQDYEMDHRCTEPLRLLLTGRIRIVGAVEMAVWLHPASEDPEARVWIEGVPDSSMEANRHNEHNDR